MPFNVAACLNFSKSSIFPKRALAAGCCGGVSLGRFCPRWVEASNKCWTSCFFNPGITNDGPIGGNSTIFPWYVVWSKKRLMFSCVSSCIVSLGPKGGSPIVFPLYVEGSKNLVMLVSPNCPAWGVTKAPGDGNVAPPLPDAIDIPQLPTNSSKGTIGTTWLQKYVKLEKIKVRVKCEHSRVVTAFSRSSNGFKVFKNFPKSKGHHGSILTTGHHSQKHLRDHPELEPMSLPFSCRTPPASSFGCARIPSIRCARIPRLDVCGSDMWTQRNWISHY